MVSGVDRRLATAAVSLILVHLLLALHGAARHSAVFDEVVYPTSGYSYLTTADHRMNPEHPPLLKLLTGACWLGTGLSAEATPGWVEGDQWRFGRSMLYGGPVRPDRLLFRARAGIAALSMLLAAAVFLTAWRLGGGTAALAGLTLYVFDPLVGAHAGLATTDLGAAAFYFLASLSFPGAVLRGEWSRMLLAGLLLGLGLASKFSLLPLLVVLAAFAVAGRTLERLEAGEGSGEVAPRIDPRHLGRAAVVLGVGVLVLIACYGPAGPAGYLRGLGLLGHHEQVGHPAYAFGHYGDSGWWWFFPAAWAVKTPLPILLGSLSGVTLLLVQARKRPRVAMTLLLPVGLLAVAATLSSLNLGVRHLLPLTPFLAVAGGLAVSAVWRSGRTGAVLVLLGGGWLIVGTLRVHPDELAYSNELAGGPGRTWRVLADSNVDWGQDLPALAGEIGRYPLRRLYLSYFGTADPAAHGLVYQWSPGMGMAERRFQDGPEVDGREWIAISVTNLLDVYTARHDAHAWLRERRFSAFPGRSIALFDITDDARAHWMVGRTAVRFADAEAAEPALRRALELDPGNDLARADLLRVLAARGRRDELATECARATAERLRELCTELLGEP